MKKLLLVLAVGLAGMAAKADDTMLTPMDNEMQAQGAFWLCGMHFKGMAKGFKIVAGHFKSTAYGTLSCKSIHGDKWSKDVKISFGAKCLSPVVGIGYMKYHGIGTEISIFNKDPEVILGKYLAVNAQGAVILGAGTFRAVKVGLPQLAMNMAIQLDKGFGVNVGIDHLYISDNGSEPTPTPEPPTPSSVAAEQY
ncbi:MAG: hypothetical protein J7501_03400 [Bdellovibrio sp.]|nr:hypothetical protein [Bdellovibrio sp.]